MLGRAARVSLPALGPDGSQASHSSDGDRHLHLRCAGERHYDCTRGALLAQLIQSCLHRLVERGATHGDAVHVDVWPVAHTGGLDRCLDPLCDEETLWALAGYVDEISAERHSELSAEGVVIQTRACIELVLTGVPGVRWWSSRTARLARTPEVAVGVDVQARRFYFACGVFDSAEVCRRWTDPEVVRRAIDDQIALEESRFPFGQSWRCAHGQPGGSFLLERPSLRTRS